MTCITRSVRLSVWFCYIHLMWCDYIWVCACITCIKRGVCVWVCGFVKYI